MNPNTAITFPKRSPNGRRTELYRSDGATPKAVVFCEAACYRYFGAWYYMGDVSVWLNVDPLREDCLCPYTFYGWNHVNVIDPTDLHYPKYKKK